MGIGAAVTCMPLLQASLLKGSDINSDRWMIPIRQGKDARDRDVPLAPKLLEALREYQRRKKPEVDLFPTRQPSGARRAGSERTVWYLRKIAAGRTGNRRLSHR